MRGWSVRDSMIYACLSTNVITLGLVEFAYQDAFPAGQLLTAVLISAVWVSFLVLAYSGLVVTIPGRAATTSGRAGSSAAGSAS